jgi:hypothetical protein
MCIAYRKIAYRCIVILLREDAHGDQGFGRAQLRDIDVLVFGKCEVQLLLLVDDHGLGEPKVDYTI